MNNFVTPRDYPILKALLRALVTVLIIFLPMLMIIKISNDHVESYFWLMIIKRLFPLIAVGYLIFGVSDSVCAYLGLYDVP